MPERVRSDHPSVETFSTTVERRGRTDRHCLALPAAARESVPVGDVVRVVLDGDTRRGRVEQSADGDLRLPGVFDTPAQVRSPGDGENRLEAWLDARGLDAGRTVELDVVVEAFAYGLRAPGETAVYDVHQPPDSSLSAIADDLAGDSDGTGAGPD